MVSNYRYRCRTCNKDVLCLSRSCQKCGLVTASFDKSTETSDVSLRCNSCGGELPLQALPSICNEGHRGKCGWWDVNKGDWATLEPEAAPKLSGDVWVSGWFEGAYVGKLAGALVSGNKEDERHYRINEFESAQLKDVVVEQGPPPLKGKDGRPPIRMQTVMPVVISIGDGSKNTPKQFIAQLEEFRLYDWRELNAGEHPLFSGKQSVGWLSGRAYGVLHDFEASDDKNPEEFVEDLNTSVGASENAGYSEGHLIGGGHNQTQTADSGSPLAPEALEEEPDKPCFACSVWLRLLLTALVWYVCSWKHALVFVGVSQLTCWLSGKLIIQRGWRRNLLIALITLLTLVGSLLEAYALAFSDDCSLITDWPIYLIGAAFVLTAFIPFCWMRLLMLLIWFATTAIWCGANGVVCNKDKDEKRVDVVVNEVDVKIDYVIHPDLDVDVINDNTNDPTNPDNNRKISIDEVTKDPELLEKCGNSIYFSEVALFQVKQYDIEPRATIQLRKLAEVLKKKPDRKVIITGHADKSGDDSDDGYIKNIDLSNERAKAVAEWLVQNAGIDESRLEIRGAGTSMPITTDPQSSHLNRRVEVELECPRDKNPRHH